MEEGGPSGAAAAVVVELHFRTINLDVLAPGGFRPGSYLESNTCDFLYSEARVSRAPPL